MTRQSATKAMKTTLTVLIVKNEEFSMVLLGFF